MGEQSIRTLARPCAALVTLYSACVPALCLPSTSKFSMLDGMQLPMNLLLPDAHIQAARFAPSATPAAEGGAAQT